MILDHIVLLPYLPKIAHITIILPVEAPNISGLVANSLDPNQTPHYVASDLGLLCLLKSVCPNNIQGKYGNSLRKLGSIAQSNLSFEPQLGNITFVEIDHEIISTVILPLPLIQEGQLSVTGKIICTKY